MTPIKLYDGLNKDVALPLDKFIKLDECEIPNAKICIRELDENHLESIIELEANELPPVEIVLVKNGAILLDGYHRFERAKRKGETTLNAISRTYTSEYDVLNFAFSANLKHGLPANKLSRTTYGLWLYVTPNNEGKNISLREASRIAGISHVALSNALKRMEENNLTEQINLKDKSTKLPDIDVETNKLLKSLNRYFSKEHSIFTTDIYDKRNENLRARNIANHILQSEPTNETIDMLLSLANSLYQASELLKNNPK